MDQVLTDDGLEYLTDKCVGEGTLDFDHFKVGKGSSGSAPETQTALNSPHPGTFTDFTLSKVTALVWKFTGHLPKLAGFEDDVNECGIYTETGKLFGYAVFTTHAKTDLDEGWLEFEFTWR